MATPATDTPDNLEASSAESAAPARKPRARRTSTAKRTSRRSSTADAAASAQSDSPAPSPEEASSQSTQQESEPASKPRRRASTAGSGRSRAKKAAQSTSETDADGAQESAEDVSSQVEELPAARDTKKKTTRTRRSTKKTASQVAATENAGVGNTDSQDVPGGEMTDEGRIDQAQPVAQEEEVSKPAKTRASRSKKAASSQSAQEGARTRRKTVTANEKQTRGDGDDGAQTSASEPAQAQESSAGGTPMRKRRRVVAAQGAPQPAPPAEDLLAQTFSAASPVAESEEPDSGVDSAEDADTAVAQEPAEATDNGESVESATDGEMDEEDADGVGESGEEQAAFLPAASLLFQTPDASRARRRRVVAPQAAPHILTVPSEEELEEAAAASRHGATTSAGQGRKKNASPHVSDASAQGVGDDAAPAPRRKRRRVVAAQATPEHVEEIPADQVAQELAALSAKVSGSAEAQGDDASDNSVESAEVSGSASLKAEQASQEPTDEDDGEGSPRRKRRRGGRGRRSRNTRDAAQAGSEEESQDSSQDNADEEVQDSDLPLAPSQQDTEAEEEEGSTSRRRRRRRSRSRSDATRDVRDEVTALKGSTRLEAKRQRRREGRAAGRRRPIVTEAEFLARRESVDRQMIVREQDGLNQIAVLEDGILVEHYVARHTQASLVGNVYVGRVQNVLPSMEAAFVDIAQGRNAVLYAGEVNWDLAGMEGKPRRIEDALKTGDTVLVQVTKDPIGHKGARLTSQITLAGRYLVLVPGGTMTGISRKLPDTERSRLKSILRRIVPDDAGVIVRTAAEGASEEQLRADVERLRSQWESIEKKSKPILSGHGKAPALLKGEPELAVRVVRDVFNEDFRKLIVQGSDAWQTLSEYVTQLSPDLASRLEHWVSPEDVFSAHRIDEQLAKGFDRKVWLPSGGTLIIDRTEAMTVIDVNTGRFTGSGGTLEETVTRNNIEAAEEIVRQLRLRDIGGMIVIDFVDMVLESNRDLVLRRLVECLGRDRTRHQVTEVTSLGLVQMTRKRVGQGLVEAFSTPCECCGGRGFIVHGNPVENQEADMSASASRGAHRAKSSDGASQGSSSRRGRRGRDEADSVDVADDATRAAVRGALAQIAAAAEHAHRDIEAPHDEGHADSGADEHQSADPADSDGQTAASEGESSATQEVAASEN